MHMGTVECCMHVCMALRQAAAADKGHRQGSVRVHVGCGVVLVCWLEQVLGCVWQRLHSMAPAVPVTASAEGKGCEGLVSAL